MVGVSRGRKPSNTNLRPANIMSHLMGYTVFNIVPFCLSPGFNVETVNYKNVNFTAWDVGGRDKIVSCTASLVILCTMQGLMWRPSTTRALTLPLGMLAEETKL